MTMTPFIRPPQFPLYQPQPATAAPANTYTPAPSLAAIFGALFGDCTSDVAAMGSHSSPKKYHQRPDRLTPTMLEAHLAGDATYATIIQRGGQARWICIDIDQGGTTAVQHAVDQLAAAGIWAFGVLSFSAHADGTPAHEGGHIWIPLAEPTTASELHQAGRGLIAALGIASTEVWPQPRTVIRLPFGRNLRSQAGHEWGGLVLAHQPMQHMSSGTDGLRTMLDRYRPNQPAAILPYCAQAPQPTRSTIPPRPAQQGMPLSDNPMADFNRLVDVRTIIERNAGAAAHGGAYHCPGKGHKHQDRGASLLIRPSPKYGYVAMCYAPDCELHKDNAQRGQNGAWGSFDLMCVLEHGNDLSAAMRAARAELGMPAIRRAPITHKRLAAVVVEPIPAPDTLLAAVLLAAAVDTTLTKTARRVLTLLATEASGQGWCQVSNTVIQAGAACQERAVQYATAQLQTGGYLRIDYTGNAYGGNAANIYRFVLPHTGGGVQKPCTPIDLKESKRGQDQGEAEFSRDLAPKAERDDASIAPAPEHAPDAGADSVTADCPRFLSRPLDSPLVVTEASPSGPAAPPELSDIQWAGACAAFEIGKLRAWCAVEGLEFDRVLDGLLAEGRAAGVAVADTVAGGRAPLGAAAALAVRAEDDHAGRMAFAEWADAAYERAGREMPDAVFWSVGAGKLAPPVDYRRLSLDALERYVGEIVVGDRGRTVERRIAPPRPVVVHVVAGAGGAAAEPDVAALKAAAVAAYKRGDRIAGNKLWSQVKRLAVRLGGTSGGESGGVAIGHVDAGVAELGGEGRAGGRLGQTMGEGAVQEQLGVGGAKGMHAQADASADVGGADSEPVTDSTDSEPVTDSTDSEHPTDSADSEPVTDSTDSEPVTVSADSEPVTDSAVSEPVTDSADSEPVTDSAVSEPVTDSAVSEPVTDSAVSEPVTDSAVSEPVTDSAVSEHPADSEHPTDSAVSEQVTDSEKMTDSAVSEPVTDSTDSERVTDSTVSEPVTDSAVSHVM
jgi:hypothetical protein